MGHRGRLQVKPEKKSGAGPVPVKIEDEWTDSGKVRVFTFSDGTKTRVPWRETERSHESASIGGRKYEAPTFEDAVAARGSIDESSVFRTDFPTAVADAYDDATMSPGKRARRAIFSGAITVALGVGELMVRGFLGAFDVADAVLRVFEGPR